MTSNCLRANLRLLRAHNPRVYVIRQNYGNTLLGKINNQRALLEQLVNVADELHYDFPLKNANAFAERFPDPSGVFAQS